MLDRSSKLDDSLMDAYKSIHEVHKGHAAGSSDIEKQASQLASDIRYKAKGRIKDGMNPEDKKRVYLSLLSSSSAPSIVKTKAKKKLLGESVIGEEGYDHMRDKELEHGGIGAVASRSPSRSYTRSEKQPKGKTVLQKETEAKYGKGKSALDIVKQQITDKYGKGSFKESAADKIISSIRSKRFDEGKLVHGPFGPYITDQKMPKEQREVPLKDVPYESLNGNRKSVGEEKKKGLDGKACWKGYKLAGTKKKNGRTVDNCVKVDEAKYDNTKSPDYKKKKAALAKKHGGYDKIKGHPQYEEVTNEAKVDKVKHGDNNLYDNPGKEKDRNERKFGKQSFNQKGQTQLRRGLHWSKRGDKKVKGAKVEEEVGVSSSAAMSKAIQDAKLKSKEEAAVKKAKKVKNEEVSPAVEKVIEAIKINKASPKSPNCIIMPKKDDITDKAGGKKSTSTKEVVTKKQKQFFNQEDKVKTFRQFVTETEYVDEGWGSLVKGAVKSGASLAKGAAKVGGEVAKGTAKEIGTAGAELGRGVSNVAKHGGRALQTGASEFKKTGSLSKGIEAGGQSMERRKILSKLPSKQGKMQGPATATGEKPTMKGAVDKQAKQNWKRTKAKIGKRAQQTKDGLEVAANVKQLQQDQEDKSRQGAGGKVGERQAPT